MSSKNVTLRFCNNFLLFQAIMLAKCVLGILELNNNNGINTSQTDKKTKLKSCGQVLVSPRQQQNMSFTSSKGRETALKRSKMKRQVQSVQNYSFSSSNV